jgi:very-short-patch-repair endonuclease
VAEDEEGRSVDVESLEEIAQRQYSLFTLMQAAACGLNRKVVYRRVRRGQYVHEQPSVFSYAGAPVSWERSVLAACLSAGANTVASHRTAARLWGLLDEHDDLIELTVPRGRLPRAHGVTIHRSTNLDPGYTTLRKRIPVTNPLRTMVDLAAVLPPDKVEDALDAGLRWPALFSVAAVETTLERLAGRGRTGTGVLKELLAERVSGDAVSDSELEKRMGKLLQRAGLPKAAFHYAVCTPAGLFLAEVDFAYPALRLAIEVDGFGVHGTPRAMAKDFVRQNGLVPFGWRVLRFTWRQVTREPAMVAAAIRGALEGLRAA